MCAGILWVFSVVRVVIWSLILCVCYIDRRLSFCPFSFGRCVVDDGLQCISTEFVCDRKVHCKDASDEQADMCAGILWHLQV
jgi:hypothetical protein